MSTLYFLPALSRLCWRKVIIKAAEGTAKRLEKRAVPSARVWLSQRSGLSQQKQNTLEGSFKKRIANALSHGDRLVKNTSSVIL